MSSTDETTETVQPNSLLQDWVTTLKKELGSDFVQSELVGNDLTVRVNVSAWQKAGEVCKQQLGCDSFTFLSGLDWLPNPNLSGEKTFGALEGEDESGSIEMTSGVAGGDTRFQVFARLFSTTSFVGITLKADLPDDKLEVPTWVSVYAGADWHERETWEMYGFDFIGHPGLRHMYLPGEFEGNPMRKDFPLLAREVKPWPGLVDVEPIPGDDADGGES